MSKMTSFPAGRRIHQVQQHGRQVSHNNRPGGRQFQEKWLLDYEWLAFDEVEQLMWCSVCRGYRSVADPNSAFVKGTSNFNHPAFDKHQRSEPHQRCLYYHSSSTSAASSTGMAPEWDRPTHQQQPKRKQVTHHAVIPTPSTAARPLKPVPQQLSQLLQIHWKEHSLCMNQMFSDLLAQQHFVDVTLTCEEGHSFHCHKMVLSACSSYFKKILTENPCPHPIIFLRDIKSWEVEALVDFMYKGLVSVERENLQPLIKAAEALKIRGLSMPAEVAEEEPVTHIRSCKRKQSKDCPAIKKSRLSPKMPPVIEPKTEDNVPVTEPVAERCQLVIVKLEPAESDSEKEITGEDMDSTSWMDEHLQASACLSEEDPLDDTKEKLQPAAVPENLLDTPTTHLNPPT